MLGHDRAILLLHGDVSFSAIPHLEAVLDSVIAPGIPSLIVDLSDTAKADSDALDAIRRCESQLQSLNLVEGCWP
jgi:anti-anti-sigma regulatory factor